jgi:Putative endonuclease segE, GIY-YIG domain
MDLGHWTTNENIDNDNLPYGFIYRIINTVSGKIYFGKKQIKSVKKLKPLKGRKNKRHFDIETDWKSYTSSSNDVNEDIERLGKDKFKFEIIRFCDSKFELAYYEAKIQFDHNVLLKEGYYNGIINCRIGRAPNALLNKLAQQENSTTITNNAAQRTQIQSLSC